VGIAALVVLAASVAATPGAAPAADNVVGEITAVDAGARQLTLRSDAGNVVRVSVPEGATVLRVRPGAKDLEGALVVSLTDAAGGDRAMIRGRIAADPASFEARRVVLLSRTDLAQKHQAETDDWLRRGVRGIVSSVEAATGQITIRLGRAATAEPLVIATAAKPAAFRRYAPDSVRFADARPSSLAAVRPGDELRALGDRPAAGGPLEAEQVVFGTFRMVVGPIVSASAADNRLVVRDEETKQELTVATGPDARLRRLPAEMAARLSRRAQAPEAAPPEAARWRPNPEEMIDRLPAITIADLNAGDRVMISSTRGEDAARLNAIVLVSGLEALSLPAGPRRGGRGIDVGLPAELLDLGMNLQ
jgi:hypothetical protein